MTYLLFVIKSALDDFRRNKVRTFLTSLGILIGVASVIMLLALGLGLKRYITQQFDSLGTNLIYVLPYNGLAAAGGPPQSRFDNKDVDKLKRIKNVVAVTPVNSKSIKMEANGKTERVSMNVGSGEIFDVINIDVEFGRKFDVKDEAKGSKVIVLGHNAAQKLFTTAENALGKTVKIEQQRFTVIGITEPKGGGGAGIPSIDDEGFATIKAMSSFFDNEKYFGIYIRVNDKDNLRQVKEEANTLLRKRYKEDEVSAVEQTEFLNTITSIFNILNSVLVAIAAISLVVGGVGIMNIMYVSVTERIKEIGIRRAIGATKKDILIQFLSESIILSIMGGLLGLGLAYGGVIAVQSLFPAYIDTTSVIIALGVSSGIGILFGVFPAKKAADLSPIDAIRYE